MSRQRTQVEVEFKAQMGGFERSIKGASRGLESARGALNKVGKAVFSLQGALVAVGGAAGFGYLLQKQGELIDVSAKLARSLNIQTEAFKALNHAVSLTTVVTEEQFGQALKDMQKSLGEGKKAFEDLGLSVEKLKQLSPEEQFLAIGEALEKVESHADKIALSEQIFAEPGTKLLNLFKEGSERIREMANEAHELGIAFSDLDAAKVESANDAMARAAAIFEGVKNRITIQLAPVIEKLAFDFVNVAKATNGFQEQLKQAGAVLAYIAATIADVIYGLKGIWKIANLGVAAVINGGVQMLEFFFKIGDSVKMAFASVTNFVIEQIDKVLAAWQGVANKVSKIPGLGGLSDNIGSAREGLRGMRRAVAPMISATRQKVGGIAAASRRNVDEAIDDIFDYGAAGSPGAKIKDYFKDLFADDGKVAEVFQIVSEKGETVMEPIQKGIEKTTAKIKEFGEKSDSVLSNFLKSGELTFENFGKMALESLINSIALPGGAGGLITDLFGISGGDSGGFFSNLLGSTFGGFFANGGTLSPGQWGIAGENGPEAIYSGSAPLNVMTNKSGRGHVSVSNYNYFNTDNDSIRQQIAAAAPLIKQDTINGIEQMRRRGAL